MESFFISCLIQDLVKYLNVNGCFSKKKYSFINQYFEPITVLLQKNYLNIISLLYFWKNSILYNYQMRILYYLAQFVIQKKKNMINRLPQLKKFLGQQDQIGSDNAMNSQAQSDTQAKQGVDEQFFQDIKTVRQMIIALNKNNYKIQSLKGKYAKAIKSTQQKTSSEEMNEILNQNADMHLQIKKKINDLKDRVNDAEKNQPDQPETRMKKNFYLSLSKQVADVLQKQQSYEDQYKTTVKQKVIRQVKLIDREIDDQQAEQYVQNPDLAQQMLQKKIYGQASTTLKNTVSDIQDKLNDIKKLQRSVNQCMQLFNQLQLLVQAQGEKINSIEKNVDDAKDYVGKAQQKLKEAKQHHKWSKKCKCAMIIAGLVLLIIIIIVVSTTTSKK